MRDTVQDTKQVVSNKNNLRALIDNMDDPIWLVGTDYHIIECNAAFRKWVSCFIDTEIGKGDNVLFNGRNKIYHDKFEMCYRLALGGHTFRTVEDMKVGEELRYTNVSFNP